MRIGLGTDLAGARRLPAAAALPPVEPWRPGGSWEAASWDAAGSWTSRDGRRTLTAPNPDAAPVRDGGVLRFDGADDALGDPAARLPLATTHDLGDDVVCTGLARLPSGEWWVVDHGGGARAPRLIRFDAAFATRTGEIALGALTPVPDKVQGLVHDPNSDSLWLADGKNGLLRQLDQAGVERASIGFGHAGGLALDRARGELIAMQLDTAPGRVIRRIDLATGATVAQATIDEPDRDHLFFDEASRTLILSAGKQYAGGSATRLVFYDTDGPDFLREIARIAVPEVAAVEGLALHDGRLSICDDHRFHGGPGDRNTVRVFEAGAILGRAIEMWGVVSWPRTTQADALLVLGEPLAGYGFGLYPDAVDGLRFFAGAGGGARFRRVFSALPSFAVPRILFARFDAAGRVDAAVDRRDGTIGVRGRGRDRRRRRAGLRSRSVEHGRRARWRVRPTSAARDPGDRLRGPPARRADERERIEGWLAHAHGLAGQLPDGHRYREAAP